MNETLRQVLESKDQIIQALQSQLQKQRKILDSSIQIRQSNKKDLDAKAKDIEKMKMRIVETRKLIDGKRKDPSKQQKIAMLRKQVEEKQRQYEMKHGDLATQKTEYHYLRDIQCQLENKKMAMNAQLEKHQADDEDVDYLQSRDDQSLEQIKVLKEQHTKLVKSLEKKKAMAQVNGNQSDQGALIDMLKKIADHERKAKVVEDQIMNSHLTLKTIQAECVRLLASNTIVQDKLIYTLGRQKGASTGTICFFIRYRVNDFKLNELLENVEIQISQNQNYIDQLREASDHITSKPTDKVSDADLQGLSQITCEVDNWTMVLDSQIQADQSLFSRMKKLVNNLHEKVRVKCAKEVYERLKITDSENKDGVVRIERIEEILLKFDKELDRLLKISRLQYRKEDFLHLKQILGQFKDSSNELNSNFLIMKLVIEKSRAASYGCDKHSLSKLDKMLQQIRGLEQCLLVDLLSLQELEKKVKDFQINFNDLVKLISKETHDHLVNQLNEKQRQAQELQKKDRELQNVIEGRKSDLFNIKNQIEDSPDKELQNIFATNQLNLTVAGEDEEQAQEQQRQILNRTDNLMKQFQRLEPQGIQAFEQANDLLEQLDEMDSFIVGTEQKIEEGFQKAISLEENLREMERRLRNQRISDCEKAIKLDTEQLEKLKRILEKLNTQLSVIQRDQTQLLNADGFQDQEKRKEIASFANELDQKEKQLNHLNDAKEGLRVQIEHLERDFQSAIGQFSTNDGREYLNLKKQADKIREEINRQVGIADGEISDEIKICKEVNSKMITKYKTKKDKYCQCVDLRKLKQEEFKEWRTKLDSFSERQTALSSALSGLGVQSNGQHADVLHKFIREIEKVKTNSEGIERQIQHFTRRIADEASDLDVIGAKVVKTAKLEDIYKLLQEVKITCDPFEEMLEKIDAQLRQIEKDVEAFMIKTRSSQLFDCEAKLKKATGSLEKLHNKIEEVSKELSSFNQEVTSCQSKIEKKDALTNSIEEFQNQLESSDLLKDQLKDKLQQLLAQFAMLDKKNLSVTECTQIINDATSIDERCNQEFNSVVDLQEKLRELLAKFRTQTQTEQERQKLLQIAKAKLKDNQALIKQAKTLINHNQEKVGDFQTIYTAMHQSDDYSTKKPIIEKNMRRMRQLEDDVQKYDAQKQALEDKGSIVNISEEDLDKIQDLEQLQSIIAQNEKVHQQLKTDVKDLGEMKNGFEKRRRKIADAEIRQIATKRKEELEKVRNTLVAQMDKLNQFEEQLLERQREQSNVVSPEKQNQLQRTLQELKDQFAEFKDQFEKVDHEIAMVNDDIARRDLEKDEPLPKLAQDIERLRKTTFEVKDLKFELEKIQIELQAKSTMLSSMDTEKKLRGLLEDLEKAQYNDDKVQEALLRVRDISQQYIDGYTSGAEDEEFCTVIYSESRDLLQDFTNHGKSFQDLSREVQSLMDQVEEKKQQSGGNLKSEDVEDLNEQIGRLDARLGKLRRAHEEVEIAALGNKDKMGMHDAHQKLGRRQQELEELEKIIQEINNDNGNMRDKLQTEMNACQGNPKYDLYVEKLGNIMQNTYKIEEKAAEIQKFKVDIDFDVNTAVSDLSSNPNDTDQRLNALEANIDLKRRIQDTLKSISQLHALVKQVFNQTNDVFAKKPQEVQYKAAAGDDVDKMMAEILNKLGINVPIKRLGGGYYMFGSKKIFCKIINGKLVVRVGGGYMGIEEFITQYGQQELDKMNAQANVEAKLKEEAAGGKVKLPLMKPGTSQAQDSPRTGRAHDDSISNMGSYHGAQTTQNKQFKSTFSQMSDQHKSQTSQQPPAQVKKMGTIPRKPQ